MIELKDLSIADLKKMHKAVMEKIECAKEVKPDLKANPYALINPDYNPIKAEGRMVLRELDKELGKRGYNVEKLFKGYKQQ